MLSSFLFGGGTTPAAAPVIDATAAAATAGAAGDGVGRSSAQPAVDEAVGNQQQMQVSTLIPKAQQAVSSVEPQAQGTAGAAGSAWQVQQQGAAAGTRQPGKNSLAAKLAKLGMAPAKDS
jgi:hypothetical protein